MILDTIGVLDLLARVVAFFKILVIEGCPKQNANIHFYIFIDLNPNRQQKD